MSRYGLLVLAFMSMVFLTTPFGSVTGQQKLSLQEAVRIGLRENLNIETLNQEKLLATVNTGNGAAGMLPTVTATGDVGYTLSNTKQQFLDGRENAIAAGSTFRANAGVNLNWTIFDGMAMFIRRDQLDKELELVSLELQSEAQTLSADIASTYQNLVLQNAIIQIMDANVAYLEDLVQLSQAKLEIGSASKLDVLQAQTDLNELINNRELAKMSFEISSASLNRDLNRSADLKFQVDTVFAGTTESLSYENWVERALKSNFEIKRSRKVHELAIQDIELVNASRKPTVALNSSLDVGYLNSNTGFLTSNRSIGPTIGLTVAYNIFDGHRLKRETQIAEISAKISELAIDRVSLETKNTLYIAFQQYQYYKRHAELEQENLLLAAENFELANALFQNGGITQYELRQVRIQRLAIQRRLVEAEYQMALAYIGLMEVSGQSWL